MLAQFYLCLRLRNYIQIDESMKGFLSVCKKHIWFALVMSLTSNLLMLAVPLYTLQVFDRVFGSRSVETLAMLSLVTIVALIAMTYFEVIRSRLLLSASMDLDKSIGHQVLSVLLDEVGRGRRSDVANLRDVATIRSYMTGNGIVALFDLPWVPIFMLLIFMFHPLLGTLGLISSLVLLGLAWLNERITRSPTQELMLQSRISGRFIDSAVRNAEVARAMGMSDAIIKRWESGNQQVMGSQTDLGLHSTALNGVIRFVRLLAQLMQTGVGAWLVLHNEMGAGAMVASGMILARAFAPIENAVGSWKAFLETRDAYRRISELLDSRTFDGQVLSLPAPRGQLSVERLVMGWAERPVLKGVSFELSAGESLGLIGPSGAGKSTLARLLTGLWKPYSGIVRLDGADISQWPREDLGRYIGYLPQDVELFPGTVAENIARMQSVESEAVIEASRMAGVHDLILGFVHGYQTEVGENGMNLSAGQRQRIGLARTLFQSPRLIVLDEPNANLDHDGEVALTQSLVRMKEASMTVVVISHRPSILSNVDKIMVLRDGVIEKFGVRNEILALLNQSQPRQV
jgi:PrtD family type I secretion system ABC transporter